MAIALCAMNAEAQERRPRSVAVVGGVLLSNHGDFRTGRTVGIRATFPASRTMLVEPGITYVASGADESGPGGGALITELQVQAQFGERVRPFIGVGGGVGFGCSGICAIGVLLSTSAGVRAPFSNGWGGRAEVRMRGLNLAAPGETELTIGISHVF